MKKIYCDISATTPVNEQVIDLMTSIHKSTFGNPSSVHKYGQESHIVIEKARIETAQALNCHQEEIIFTASGTEANNIALEGLVESDDHIISSTYEHPSIMNVIKALCSFAISPLRTANLEPANLAANSVSISFVISK